MQVSFHVIIISIELSHNDGLLCNLCSPANMIAAAQQDPTAAVLWGLKECLDFSGGAWTAVFDRIGGCELLTEVKLQSLVALNSDQT